VFDIDEDQDQLVSQLSCKILSVVVALSGAAGTNKILKKEKYGTGANLTEYILLEMLVAHTKRAH
jgi:hypothetical protein